MTRGYLPLLLLVSGLWGASYLFIKVALEDMEPSTMMAIRLLLAGAVMFAVLSARAGIRRTLADLRAVGRHAVVLGVINGALPFWLIAWGEKYVDSGVAAIANATVPIFVALLAIRIRPSERASGSRLVGILVGLVGVAVLARVDPGRRWRWPARSQSCSPRSPTRARTCTRRTTCPRLRRRSSSVRSALPVGC